MLGRLNDDNLSTQFYMFLIGEIDGIPKDPKFIYQLNIAIGKIKEASDTAMIIA
jgi:WD repeat-containing protein 19